MKNIIRKTLILTSILTITFTGLIQAQNNTDRLFSIKNTNNINNTDISEDSWLIKEKKNLVSYIKKEINNTTLNKDEISKINDEIKKSDISLKELKNIKDKINKNKKEVKTSTNTSSNTEQNNADLKTVRTPSTTKNYTLQQFMFSGVVNWGGYKFTYYSQSVLPGGGLAIPGRHVNADGYVSDGDGYVVLAGSAPKGTIYDTPFGYKGKIYDRGTYGNHLDVYIR